MNQSCGATKSNAGNLANGRPSPFRLHLSVRCVAVLLLAAAFPVCAIASPPKHRAKQAAAPPVDPHAMEALNAMGAYLRTLQSFQVRATISTDDVLDDGQIVESSSTVDALVARPNRLRMKVDGDETNRLYLYDGKSFTIWGELNNYYATVAAPPTISELVDKIGDRFGIELPLVDLFRWGTDPSFASRIEKAADIGPTSIDGVSCEQYVFHQVGIDWQIWIQLGQYPLPRKLVIRTLTDAARPSHSQVLTWNLAPAFNDGAFTFDPPAGAQKIAIEETDSKSEQKH